MPIISKIELFEQPVKHTLSVRTTIPFHCFPATAQEVYCSILEHLGRRNNYPAGEPFVCYHNTDLENLDVEMGFPVSELVSGYDNIHSNLIPAQKTVSGLFLGAYEQTDLLLFEMLNWITEHGYNQQGKIYHYYLNNEDRDPNELLTRIVIPIT